MPRNPTIFESLRSRLHSKTLVSLSSMRSLSRFTKTLTSLQKSLRPFSSRPSADRRSDAIEDSPAYLRSVLRRPPTLKPWNLPRNSCSFIGTVIRPVKRYDAINPRSDVYTILEVKTPSRDSDPSSDSCSSFKIFLLMRGKLSEISLRHLEPNDYIYVSGALSSYKRVDAAGKCDILYKVAVSELNIVTRQDKNQVSQKSESAVGSLTEGTSCEPDQEKVLSDNDERYRDRLRLWQVFFANPHEWWDNRQDKRNPGSPDFKHKDTKECLWLNPDDPPWIRKQLQLYDSSMGIRHHSRQDAFEWKAKDYI